MSLFEKIKNKRYDLQEIKKEMGGGSNSSSNNNTRTQNQRKNIKKEYGPGYDKDKDLIIGDPNKSKGEEELLKKELEGKKKEKFTKYEKDRAKSLKTTPAKLERDVQKGLTSTGGRTSRFPFAKKSYKTSGKAILSAREKYKLDPTGNVDMKTTKARLVDRIVRNDPKFNVGSATKFVDELEKSQGPLSKKTGKQSSLYKTVKAEIDARNPTVKSKESGGKLPLRSKKTGEVVKKNLEKFYKKVGDKVDPKFKTPKNLDRTELNLQFKADKLKQDYGGKLNPRDGLTATERKKKLKELQRQINIKNPTITSPVTGGQLPATKTNLRKYGFLDGNFKKQNYKKTFTSSGSGSQKSFSMGQSRFKKLTSKIKMPRTQTLRKVGKYALGAYVLNQVLNPGGGGAPIPPPKKEKLTGVKVKDFKFNLAGPGGDGYKPAGMIKK